jgi:hypothetical protein
MQNTIATLAQDALTALAKQEYGMAKLHLENITAASSFYWLDPDAVEVIEQLYEEATTPPAVLQPKPQSQTPAEGQKES